MKTILPYLKTGLIGLVMGLVGASAGALPVIQLRQLVMDLWIGLYGSYAAVPGWLNTSKCAFPLYVGAIFLVVPAAGALLGLLGAFLGMLRRSRRVWLWGLLAGLLVNLFVCFYGQ